MTIESIPPPGAAGTAPSGALRVLSARWALRTIERLTNENVARHQALTVHGLAEGADDACWPFHYRLRSAAPPSTHVYPRAVDTPNGRVEVRDA